MEDSEEVVVGSMKLKQGRHSGNPEHGMEGQGWKGFQISLGGPTYAPTPMVETLNSTVK